MKKTSQTSLLGFIVIYVASLIYWAPASLLNPLLNLASQHRLSLANCNGSLWHGSATPVMLQRDGGLITFDTLRWTMDFRQLIQARLLLRLDWENSNQSAPMVLKLSPNDVSINQLYLPLSASLIGEMSEFIKPAGLRGRIIVRGDNLNISHQGIEGNASADWLDATSLLSNVAPLGNYRITFNAHSSDLAIQLSSLSGALVLNGNGKFTANSGLAFTGSVQAAAGQEDNLRELLNHLGPETNLGVHSFTLVPGAGK